MRKPLEFENHPSPFPGGEYRAYVKHVYDGDTFDVLIDLGLHQYAYETLRLRGIDTPELRLEEREQGIEARDFVKGLILFKQVVIKTEKDKTTFGRYVADVTFFENGQPKDLATALRDAGYDTNAS